MFRRLCFGLLTVGYITNLISGFVTFEDVRVLTHITNDCTEEIVNTGPPLTLQSGIELIPGDEDEIEDVIAGALRLLDAHLLEMLNAPKPINDIEANSMLPCSVIVQEYHTFIASTVILLRALNEKQQTFMWRGQSPVFENLSWLQALWASRNVNEQSRSFIEQQMELYKPTACFKENNEVLRRDVEVVEYMNDMLDSFA